MCSCKGLDIPAKQAKMLTEGVWFEIFLSCPGDLLAIALSWVSPEKGGQEQTPVNVRGVGESHEIVKQTDSGFGVDARESLGSPLSSEALLNSSLPHDIVMGGISRGGSWQESNPEYSLEGLMLKLNFGHLMWKKNWLIGKDSDGGKDWKQKGTTKDEMVGWHHWLNGHAAAAAMSLQSCLTLCDPRR